MDLDSNFQIKALRSFKVTQDQNSFKQRIGTWGLRLRKIKLLNHDLLVKSLNKLFFRWEIQRKCKSFSSKNLAGEKTWNANSRLENAKISDECLFLIELFLDNLVQLLPGVFFGIFGERRRFGKPLNGLTGRFTAKKQLCVLHIHQPLHGVKHTQYFHIATSLISLINRQL